MKGIFGFFALLLVVSLCAVFVGCSGNDKDRATASSGSAPSSAETAQGAAGAAMTPVEEPILVDPAASGGSTLPASAPYNQAKGPAVSQNVNPAPFLAASETSANVGKVSSSNGLVARADGTMYGPNDAPAAGVGPSTEGAAQGGAARGASNGGRGHASAGGSSATAKPSANQTSGK